jgi:hypothetical protein
MEFDRLINPSFISKTTKISLKKLYLQFIELASITKPVIINKTVNIT